MDRPVITKPVTTTLLQICRCQTLLANAGEKQQLLSGLGQPEDSIELLTFSTILRLSNPKFTSWCALTITQDEYLWPILADIIERKMWRQRDRLHPSGDAPHKQVTKAKEYIEKIRQGEFSDDVRELLSDQLILNLQDVRLQISSDFLHPDVISAMEEEYNWFAERLIYYFG